MKTRKWHLIFHLVLICFSFLNSLAQTDQLPVGYGYSVKSVSKDSNGSFLSANLHVIRSSSVFGPDIQNPNLVARYPLSFFFFFWDRVESSNILL